MGLGVRARWFGLGAIVVGVLIGGIAYAAIPDPQGVIHACYKQDGDLRFKIINAPGEVCGAGFTALNFNQTGPIGPSGQRGASGVSGVSGQKGASGATGLTGDPGVSGYEIVSEESTFTVAQPNLFFDSREVLCPEGKVQLGGGGYGEIFNASDVSLGAADLMLSYPATGNDGWIVGFQKRDGSVFAIGEKIKSHINVVCANVRF